MSRTTFCLVAALTVAAALGLGGSLWTPHGPPGASLATRARADAPPDRAPPAERPAPPALEEAPAPLERYLRRWETQVQKAQPLAASFTRRDIVKGSGDTTGRAGVVKLLAPDRALLEMHEQEKPESLRKFVLTGETLSEYILPRKGVRQRSLPAGRGWLADADLVPLALFRVRAADVQRAADFELVKEDPYYVYLAFRPRPGAGVDWTQGRLVLLKETGLPRQLWLAYPGSEVTWDVPAIRTEADMGRRQFDLNLPPGWKMIRDP